MISRIDKFDIERPLPHLYPGPGGPLTNLGRFQPCQVTPPHRRRRIKNDYLPYSEDSRLDDLLAKKIRKAGTISFDSATSNRAELRGQEPPLERARATVVQPELPVRSEPFESDCNPNVREPVLVPFDHERATERGLALQAAASAGSERDH